MIHIETSDRHFLDLMACRLGWRGIEYVKFDVSNNQRPPKQGDCYFASHDGENVPSSNRALIEFLKSNRFSKAVIAKFGCDEFYVDATLNNSVVYVHLPVTMDTADYLREYYLQFLIEVLVDGLINLPCAETQSADIMNLLRKLAQKDITVLVNGPTGSGKELISQLIHHHSNRREGPFIAVNCAAIPEQMLEATLFGHEKGAFTGALQKNTGLFRAASSGTILLDEISEMPMPLQAKLLRVIQEKKVMPVGGSVETSVDVRIVATTNRDMTKEIAEARFREDLYYRLNVFPVNTVSLCDRIADLPAIVAHMIFEIEKESSKKSIIMPGVFELLSKHDWPGNVRELGNVIQRAHVLSASRKITPADLIFDVNPIHGSLNTAQALAAKLKSTQVDEVQL